VGLVAPGESPLATARVVLDEGGAPSIRSSELTRVPSDVAAKALRSGQPQVLVERMAVGWRAVASEPILADDDVQAVVWVALVVPERVERLLGQITATHDDLQELQARRVPVRRLYYALFTLITLLVLFASVWAGFFLARQVTRPVQELAKGTDALAQGDLSYRVRETGDDEIGRLGESFNHMADEIQRHRRDLVARRRYIETLLEAVPLGVLSIDPKGQVSTANRAALEVLGVDELRSGRPFAEELGEQREAIVATLGPVLRGERTSVMDEVKIGPKDAEVSVEVRARRFALPARGEGVLVVLEDMTRLRRAERLAAWAEVAQRVAHEIKNPLTPIRLSAERMVRRYRKNPDGFGEVLEDGVGTIVREVEMLRSLVAEFSRFARMPHVSPEEGDVRSTVGDAVALYRDIPEKAAVKAELAKVLPRHRFDQEAMRRCLINLIDNAVAVSEDGAPVVVRVQAGPRHESVRIEVEDRGPGIPEEDRARIFDPRFSRRAGGTGLGLSIVYQIVADHGGNIRVEPNPVGGTRFVIELPAVPERSDEIITDVAEPAEGERGGGAEDDVEGGGAKEDGDRAASAAARQAGKDGER
jgi:two-component system nitrogen regulation sensor histidine kinase NtrY